jgi:ABC-2 type transport system ATP-binding protein
MSELEDSADHLVVVGRGRVIADTSVADMIAVASGGRVRLRTADPAAAITALTREGATAAAMAPDEITVHNLSAERLVAILTSASIPFSEVSSHRASLEEAYMELTRDAVEYRGGALS